MRYLGAIASVLVLVPATLAHAAPAEVARAKAVLEVQRAAVAHDDADKFAGTFAPSPLVIFPGASDLADDDESLHKLFGKQFGTKDEPANQALDAKWKDIHVVALGASTGAVASGNLVVSWNGGDSPTTFRVTELMIANPEDKSLVVLAAHVSISVPEAEATENADKKDFKPAAIPQAGDNADAAKLVSDPGTMAAALFTNNDMIVLGTETPERAVGSSAAKKLLTKWKKIKFTVNGGVRSGSLGESALGYLAANVDMPAKGKSLPFRVLVFTREDAKTGAAKILAVHFSSPAAP